MLGAGLEASNRLFGTSFWGPNPERGNREVPCLSESLSFYAESLARGRFLFLIPPPSSLDYKGCHTLGGIKAFVVV